MNKERVRQINKALKNEIQALIEILHPYYIRLHVNQIEHKHIKTYNVKQTVEESYLHQLSDDIECPMTCIKNSICNDLANKIIKDTVFKVESSTIPYHVDIVGIIEVLSDAKVESEDKEWRK